MFTLSAKATIGATRIAPSRRARAAPKNAVVRGTTDANAMRCERERDANAMRCAMIRARTRREMRGFATRTRAECEG